MTTTEAVDGRRRSATKGLLRGVHLDVSWWPRLFGAWAIGSVVLGITIAVLPGIAADSPVSVVLAVLVVEVLGALLRPVLTALAVALSWVGVFLIGIFAQAIVMYAGLFLTPGISVDDFWSALLASWLYSIITSAAGWVLSVDREDAFLAYAIRQGTRSRPAELGDEAGVVFVQLDGVPKPVLEWAVRSGNLPTMGRWAREGGHTLVGWTVRLPSTTPVSQAGILHGRSDDIPAFRWFDRDAGRLMVANRPADAAIIESRLSDGMGLLADDGVSISNLFSGDAPLSLLSMSGRREGSGVTSMLGPSKSYASFFVHPYGFARALILTIGEMVKEVFQARRQRQRDVVPRVHRGGAYIALRGVTNVMLRDLNVALVIEQMMRGAKSIYVDFVDYDEIAHHAGPTRPESLAALDGLDRVLSTLERAAAHAPRTYHFVLLSDHGQSQGSTFRQRYGQPLESVVRELMGGAPETVSATSSVEQWGPVNTLLTELTGQKGASAQIGRKMLAKRVDDNAVALGPAGHVERATAAERPELVVCGSGNLGLVYFGQYAQRLSYEEMATTWPRLVPGLAAHPGVGFVLVHSASRGPLVIGPDGVRSLDDGSVDGVDPLRDFGPDAEADLQRITAYPHAPDIYLNSLWDPSTGEVAAFEELVGCHGGLGGWQTEAVLAYPAGWSAPPERLLGAEAVHRQLVTWLEELGHRKEIGT